MELPESIRGTPLPRFRQSARMMPVDIQIVPSAASYLLPKNLVVNHDILRESWKYGSRSPALNRAQLENSVIAVFLLSYERGGCLGFNGCVNLFRLTELTPGLMN